MGVNKVSQSLFCFFETLFKMLAWQYNASKDAIFLNHLIIKAIKALNQLSKIEKCHTSEQGGLESEKYQKVSHIIWMSPNYILKTFKSYENLKN